MRRLRAGVAATILMFIAVSGCGGTTAGTATPVADHLGWTVRQALSTLPDAVVTAQTDLVIVGDLDRASTLAGVQHPKPGASAADILNGRAPSPSTRNAPVPGPALQRPCRGPRGSSG